MPVATDDESLPPAIVSSRADSATRNDLSRPAMALPVLVSSVAANSTTPTSAPTNKSASNATASAKPLRLVLGG